MNSGKVVLGVLAGIAVGAAFGILFAPDSGSSTRRKITKKGEDLADGLNDKFNEFMDQVTEKFEALKEEAFNMSENGKRKTEKV